MKTLLTTFVLVFIQTLTYAQQHQDLDELLANRKLRNFEIDMGFTDIDSVLLVHNDYVDSCYNAFFSELISSFRNDSTFDDKKALNIYDVHLANAIKGLKPKNPSSGGASVPKALNGPCVNMDFETGDFSGWQLTRGDVDGSAPYSYVNEVIVGPSTYHQIFAGGVDPVCGITQVNPAGGSFSTRLGNGTGTGARAARLRQSFLVDATNYMYQYSYAVVFESPVGHTLNELPYFTVRVFDAGGNSISCGEYSVIADAANAPGYLSTNWGGSTVLYKDWSTVFTNLSAFIGQNVTVEFTAGDCALGGHFGYAYIDASCGLQSLTTPNNTICQGDSTTITAPAGLGAYLWNTGEVTQSITVHTGGVYTCQLTPFQGPACGIVLDIAIFENPAPTADFTIPASTCISSPLVLNDLSTIPNPGIITSWQWDFGDGVSTPASSGAIVGVLNTTGTYLNPSHTYTAAGVYNVQLVVSSADGCADTILYSTTINALPIVNAGPDQFVCSGTAVTLNGAGASSYTWNNGVTDGVAFVQAVGTITYTVIGTDVNACQNIDQVNVTVWDLPNVSAGPDQVLCEGPQVSLNASGAINYAWDQGVLDGVSFLPPLGTTLYTVIGVDANGCSDSDQVQVTVNPLPMVNAGTDQAFCDGLPVTLTGSGASSYSWDNGVTDGLPFIQTSGTVTYTVTGTDANGCQNSDQVDVTIWALPNVSAGVDQIVCDGTPVSLSGNGALNYSWNNGVNDGVAFLQPVGLLLYTVVGTDVNGCESSDQVLVTVGAYPTPSAGVDLQVCENTMVMLFSTGGPQLGWSNGVQNGVPFLQAVGVQQYIVYDTTALGCAASDTVSIEVLPNPIINANDAEICEGDFVTLSGQGAVSYTWTGGVQDGVPFAPVQNAVYMVTGTAANGCTSTDMVFVEVHSKPIASFYFADADLSTMNSETGFVNTSIGGNSFAWDFGDGSPINHQFEPNHEFPYEEGAVYSITLTATSSFGCVDTFVRAISVKQDYTIYVPNAFTPDGSGINDIFLPILDGFDEQGFTLYIFNRWGELVFESHDMSVGWDGSYAGQNFATQDGVFTWKVVANVKNSVERKQFVGHVALLK